MSETDSSTSLKARPSAASADGCGDLPLTLAMAPWKGLSELLTWLSGMLGVGRDLSKDSKEGRRGPRGPLGGFTDRGQLWVAGCLGAGEAARPGWLGGTGGEPPGRAHRPQVTRLDFSCARSCKRHSTQRRACHPIPRRHSRQHHLHPGRPLMVTPWPPGAGRRTWRPHDMNLTSTPEVPPLARHWRE